MCCCPYLRGPRYLRLILAATLYGGGSAYPIASFTVTLPDGYEVLSMTEAEMHLRCAGCLSGAAEGLLVVPSLKARKGGGVQSSPVPLPNVASS